MIKIFKNNKFSIINNTVVTLIVVAFLFTGTASSVLQYNLLDKINLNSQKYIAPTLSESSDYSKNPASKKMSTDGLPQTHDFPCLMPLISIINDSSGNKIKKLATQFSNFDKHSKKYSHKSSSITSSFRVSSSLGRQFTLVGAKPSGTS
ncbi:MAG: hypothetical protein U9N54_11780 [candidate division Zixibacteria bacterium]|nr:hypothetical protein [candidate division Zixibacteria bacterium]